MIEKNAQATWETIILKQHSTNSLCLGDAVED